MASDLLRALGILPDPLASSPLDAGRSFGLSGLMPRFDLTGFAPTQSFNPENQIRGTRGLPSWADFDGSASRSPFSVAQTDYVPGTRGLPQWKTPAPAQTQQPAQAQSPVQGITPAAIPTGALPGTKQSVLQWKPLLDKYAAKYGVPVEILMALVDSESSGDPNARGSSFTYNGRTAQAQGLFQAVNMIWGADGRNLFDPDVNADTIVGQLIAPAWKKYGTPEHVRAVMAGGEGAIGPGGVILNKRDVANPNWSIHGDQPQFLSKVAAYRNVVNPPAPAAASPAGMGNLWEWTGGRQLPITGNFGEQDGPYPGSGHRGMDIGAPMGTRLTSPIEGVVVAAGDVGGGYGNQVRIQTPYGSVLLGHLASVAVTPGQRIGRGTFLGLTGNTGKSTGPHLHFELRDQRDNPINPAQYYRWA